MRISVPSKTFLCGEYLALDGGLAVMLGTEPRFSLVAESIFEKTASQNSNQTSVAFHDQSPAGRLFKRHQDFFSRFNISFHDPHFGRGGFGSSSAQFVLLSVLYQSFGNLWSGSEPLFDHRQILTSYRSNEISGDNPPSGSDLICHLHGGITFFERRLGQISQGQWSFLDKGFAILKTQNKVNTHDHLNDLKNLDSDFLDSLQEASIVVKNSLVEQKYDSFVRGLNSYTSLLAARNLQEASSLSLKETIESISGVDVAKPCGALGADVIFVSYDEKIKDKLKRHLEELGLNWISDHRGLSQGFVVDDGAFLNPQTLM